MPYATLSGRTFRGFGLRRRISVNVVINSNTADYTFGVAQVPGYIAGATDITLTVNSNVYLYSTNIANAGLTIAAFAAGDTIALVNNGYIMGMGGQGGGWGATGTQGSNGRAAGPALTINRNVSITNNSYIAGGGGGGGGQLSYSTGDPDIYYEHSGGGGAGGGKGGSDWDSNLGGNGGGPGSAGSNGSFTDQNSYPTNYIWYGGGGGGRILPGTGGASGTSASKPGKGGGSGGGGAAWQVGAAGGSADGVGGSTSTLNFGGGGGGGWGAAGGSAGTSNDPFGLLLRATGGAGGKAINLNGFTVTYITTGTLYGAVS